MRSDENQIRHSLTTTSHPTNVIASTTSLLVTILAAMLAGGQFDNDQWFILANGHYIIDHGFPYVDPFHVWGGRTVMENWGWSVLCWLAWSMASQYGLAFLSGLVLWLMIALVVSARRSLVGKVGPWTWAIATLLIGSPGIVLFSIRPAVASTAITMVIMYCWLRWSRTGKRKWLVIMMLSQVLMANVHMAMILLPILCIGCLMIGELASRMIGHDRSSGEGHLTRTLVADVVIIGFMIMCSIINPWGIDGLLFMPRSMNAAKYGVHNEMMPLLWSGVSTMAFVALLCLVLYSASIYVRWMTTRRVDSIMIGSIIMIAGLSIGILMANRNMQFLPIITFFTIVLSPSGLSLNSLGIRGSSSSAVRRVTSDRRLSRYMRSMTSVACVIIMIVSPLAPSMIVWRNLNGASAFNQTRLFDQPQVEVGEELARIASIGDSVSCFGWYGPYLTFKGFKTSDDMRPELIAPGITGLDDDWNKIQIDAMSDSVIASKYVNENMRRFKWWVYPDYMKTMIAVLDSDKHVELAWHKNGVRIYKTMDAISK